MKFLFTGTFRAPGFLEMVQFWDENKEGAYQQADAYSRQPWADWPSQPFRDGKGTVSVALALMPKGYWDDKVVYKAVCPPIPVRDFDYLARFKEDDSEKPRYEGWGSSQEEALAKLLGDVNHG